MKWQEIKRGRLSNVILFGRQEREGEGLLETYVSSFRSHSPAL
jgi:hypothetical protein